MTDEGKITDAEVEAALSAKPHNMTLAQWLDRTYIGEDGAREIMRAALLASRVLPGGEPVAWLIRFDLAYDDEWAVTTIKPPAGNVEAGYARPLFASPVPSYADAIRDGWKMVPEDLLTHIGDWRTACQIAFDNAGPPTADSDDQSYWVHQLTTLDRIERAIEALTSKAQL